MNIYLFGSVAFDEIGFFPGRFTDVIKAEHLGKLSVSFTVEDKRRFFGGCAGNVAYSLGLLGIAASICTLVGDDIGEYLQAMKTWGMDTANLQISGGHTANAFISTDRDENQIAHFAPGVIGDDAPEFQIPGTVQAGDLLLVSPEQHERMLAAVSQGKERGMRVFFDPGQRVHEFSREDLLDILAKVAGIFVNEYEWELFQTISGLSAREIIEKVELIFLTKGAKGAELYENGEKYEIPTFAVEKPVDPTGAGDAFRAGVLASMSKGLDMQTASKVGALMGAACVQHKQTQGHELSADLKHELEKLGFV